MTDSWIHLLAFTVYAGCLIGLAAIFLPAVTAAANHDSQVKFLARGLKWYNPIQSGALGILVISGAWQVTELKNVYREVFLREMGLRLGIKLTLSFILVLVSVYQSMGLAHRFVKRHESGDPPSAEDLKNTLRKLRASTAVLLLLTLATAAAGLAFHSK
jgi:uncharacterized membrane protein